MGWSNIKRDPADKAFSEYIRLTKGKCERCGRRGEGLQGITGLQASHFHSRRKESTRFDLENVDCFCIGCHKYLGSEHPEEYREYKKKQLGQRSYDLLELRANTPIKKDRLMMKIIWQGELKKLKAELSSPNTVGK